MTIEARSHKRDHRKDPIRLIQKRRLIGVFWQRALSTAVQRWAHYHRPDAHCGQTIHRMVSFRQLTFGAYVSLSLAATVILLAACTPRPRAEVSIFEADPRFLCGPGEVEITWETQGADQVFISADPSISTIGTGPVMPAGNLSALVSQDTTFAIEAVKLDGTNGTDTEEVAVVSGTSDQPIDTPLGCEPDGVLGYAKVRYPPELVPDNLQVFSIFNNSSEAILVIGPSARPYSVEVGRPEPAEEPLAGTWEFRVPRAPGRCDRDASGNYVVPTGADAAAALPVNLSVVLSIQCQSTP